MDIGGPVDDQRKSPTIDEPFRKTRQSDDCVICLAPVTERAIAVPCNHCSFDFVCLANWVDQRAKCPLCKVDITAIEYDWRSPDDYQTYSLPSTPAPSEPSSARILSRGRRMRRPSIHDKEVDIALLFRRNIYRHQRYSLHVGSNPLSGFRAVTPQQFACSGTLQSRAKSWIRRELRVFDFLRHTGPSSPSRRWAAGRINNAEYLLEYIIDILKVADVKGGQAEDMLSEHLGRESARLFLHELGSWMRSPFTDVEQWDRWVQYPPRTSIRCVES